MKENKEYLRNSAYNVVKKREKSWPGPECPWVPALALLMKHTAWTCLQRSGTPVSQAQQGFEDVPKERT